MATEGTTTLARHGRTSHHIEKIGTSVDLEEVTQTGRLHECRDIDRLLGERLDARIDSEASISVENLDAVSRRERLIFERQRNPPAPVGGGRIFVRNQHPLHHFK